MNTASPLAVAKKKILVVDDDPQIQKLLHTFLQAKGYDVVISQNGWDCLKDLVQEQPDLMIVDVKMPKLDGIGVLNFTKKGGLKKDIPIIMITGMSATETVKLAASLQTDEFLSKPFDLEELHRRVSRHLYSITFDKITAFLGELPKPDRQFFTHAKLVKPQHAHWTPHLVQDGVIELCILLAPGTDPVALSHSVDMSLRGKAAVYIRHTSLWKSLWP